LETDKKNLAKENTKLKEEILKLTNESMRIVSQQTQQQQQQQQPPQPQQQQQLNILYDFFGGMMKQMGQQTQFQQQTQNLSQQTQSQQLQVLNQLALKLSEQQLPLPPQQQQQQQLALPPPQITNIHNIHNDSSQKSITYAVHAGMPEKENSYDMFKKQISQNPFLEPSSKEFEHPHQPLALTSSPHQQLQAPRMKKRKLGSISVPSFRKSGLDLSHLLHSDKI
jgi:hypothetical protein